MEKEKNKYNNATEWIKNNLNLLAEYSGEWIAFTKNGKIAHNKDGKITWEEARKYNKEYILKFVHPFEIPRRIKILPIRNAN